MGTAWFVVATSLMVLFLLGVTWAGIFLLDHLLNALRSFGHGT
jgi:hypothetical protein